MVEIGNIVAGKYLVDRVLGQGGMGVVVQAMHLQLHQPVAIKFLHPDALRDAQIVQRFLREARAAVRLRSEHVAHVLDVGALETGAPYMVLEYLEGTDLASFPRDQLSVGRLVDLMLQACEALAEAHALGIVHRDIKPANCFITRTPGGALFLKLLDFGISKTVGDTGKLTASQVVLGTPSYMSPEQMRASRNVDHRSDIWSLGIVLYELIEGAPPFESDAFSAMVLKVVNDPLPRLTKRIPAGLDKVIYRCLEKPPAQRFQSTGELAAALAGYAESPAQAAITLERTRKVGPRPQNVAVLADTVPNRAPSTISKASGVLETPVARRRRWTMIAAAGILIGIGVVGFATIQDRTPPEAAKGSGPGYSPSAAEPDAAPPQGIVAPQPATPLLSLDAQSPAPAMDAAVRADPPVDGGVITPPTGPRPIDAVIRRPPRPRPAKPDHPTAPTEREHDSPSLPANTELPTAPTEREHDSPNRPTLPRRFDRGD